MRKALIAILFASAAFACNKSDSGGTAKAEATPADKAEAQIPAMTVDEVDQDLTAHKVVAVDVNGDATRKKMGVVPGAVLLTDDENFAPTELPADKNTKLVFYCRNES